MYLKFSELDKLNRQLQQLENHVTVIQKYVRGFQARRCYRKLRQLRREEVEAKRKLFDDLPLETLKARNDDHSMDDNLNDKFKLVYTKDDKHPEVSPEADNSLCCVPSALELSSLHTFLFLLAPPSVVVEFCRQSVFCL